MKRTTIALDLAKNVFEIVPLVRSAPRRLRLLGDQETDFSAGFQCRHLRTRPSPPRTYRHRSVTATTPMAIGLVTVVTVVTVQSGPFLLTRDRPCRTPLQPGFSPGSREHEVTQVRPTTTDHASKCLLNVCSPRNGGLPTAEWPPLTC